MKKDFAKIYKINANTKKTKKSTKKPYLIFYTVATIVFSCEKWRKNEN